MSATIENHSLGHLIVEAQKKAKKKSNGHTSTDPCGCAVTVTYFSATGCRTKFERCATHPKPGA